MIKYYYDLMQHSDEWERARKGVITASIMKNLISRKTDKKTGVVSYSVPDTDTSRAYLFKLASERLYPELGDNFQSYAMERGIKDEVEAFNLYSKNYNALRTCGFVTNDEHGVLLGYSPDGLTALSEDGQFEAKSRAPQFQVETIFEGEMPDDFMIQVQTGLIVTGRKWCDFGSFCGGAHMFVKNVKPDAFIQQEIIKAAQQAEKKIKEIVAKVSASIKTNRFILTEKRVEDIIA